MYNVEERLYYSTADSKLTETNDYEKPYRVELCIILESRLGIYSR